MTGPAITHATVEGEGTGAYRVRWDLDEAGTGTVVICAGTSPDEIDHEQPVAQVRDTAEALVELPDRAARHYFHVSPDGGQGVIAAERLVPLEGTMNFRDLGGYQASDGHVRWGLVFRADGLHELSGADVTRLRDLGIRVVHDFRRDDERERSPSRLVGHDWAEQVVLAMGGSGVDQRDLLERIFAGEVNEVTVDYMIDVYQQLLSEHARSFGVLFESLATPGRLPALFHCTAGKDRTGLAAALLLRVLGVSDRDILEDYELSNRYRGNRRIEQLRPRLEEAGVDLERVRAYLTAPRPALEAALEWIDAEHDGVDGYLARAAEVEPTVIERLRQLLVS